MNVKNIDIQIRLVDFHLVYCFEEEKFSFPLDKMVFWLNRFSIGIQILFELYIVFSINFLFFYLQISDNLGYVLYSALGSFYIPSIIMVFVYIRIYYAAKKRARRGIKKYQQRKAQQNLQVILCIDCVN